MPMYAPTSPYRRVAAPAPAPVVVYGRRWCASSQMMRRQLDRLGVPYEYVDLDVHPEAESRLAWLTGGRVSSPVVSVGGEVLVQPGAKKNRVRPVAKGTPRCAACHEPLPWLVDATPASFDEEIRSSVPVLVDLWAPWCGPCRIMAPALEQLARERAGRLKVVKVNVDEAPAISQRYRVRGVPLLVLLRHGKEFARLTGAAPAPQLHAWLNSQLTSTTAGATSVPPPDAPGRAGRGVEIATAVA